jgi:diguanylate cyclase (GGDEF)-like protein
VLSHHERWDGNGYPQGLKGEAIPIGARILSVVDYFDVVTSERPYHGALSDDSALALLKHEAGRALDPALVEMFIERLPVLVAKFEAANALDRSGRVADRVHGAAVVDGQPSAFENIALAHQEIYALYEIAQTMGRSLGVSDSMALISSKLATLIPWSGCALFLQDGDSAFVRCRFATGSDAPALLNARLRVGEGLSGWVARHRRTLVNASPRIEFEAAGVAAVTTMKSAIVCPLEIGDRFIGSLALFHADGDRYTDDHRRLLGRVAEQAAAVLNNSIVFEQTQEDSLTDSLTGLPNRRSMMARLDSEISRAERLRTELAVIVMDVDDFKLINDSHGHATGDLVLREIAIALQTGLRPYDLCVRYAGDEFVVVLAECGLEAAEAKRRELQSRVQDVVVMIGGTPLDVGVSASAAVFPHDGATHEQLLAAADDRMYIDKATRRGEPMPVARTASRWTNADAPRSPFPDP